MKLDRNKLGNDGRGKYALLKLRVLEKFDDQKAFGGLPPDLSAALETLETAGVLDWGEAETEAEFFVIRLKDRNAAHALIAYGNEASKTDPQFGSEVYELVKRAGPNSPWCKEPD
jgi:hypothetical protein